MKFLCDQCKAKYQISDDKVAGRTVRMKCRKCGYSIEVRAAVTSTSVAMKANEVAGSDESKQASPRPAKSSSLSTSLSQQVRAVPSPPRPAPRPEGSLASAFQRNVRKDEEPSSAGLALHELTSGEEWYVAINGVPVGPVRIGDVRRKAAMGSVTEDSLCWQEGMEQWRAVRTVTELAAVVREAAGMRPSQLPPEPMTPAARPGAQARMGGSHSPLPPPRPPSRVPPAPTRPSRPLSPPAETPKYPIPVEDDGAETVVGAVPSFEHTATEEPHAPANGVIASAFTADPFKPSADGVRAPTPAQAPAAVDPGRISVLPQVPGVGRQRFTPMAIAMIVMAGGFGAVAAYVLLAKRDAPIVMAVPSAAPVTTAPTASGPVAGHAPTASAPAPVTTTEVVTLVSDAGAKPAVGAHPQGAPPVPGTPKPGGSPTLADPGLRDLIASAGAGPGPAGGGPGSGPQLTEDETRSVVTQHSLAVRRTCWDRNPSAQPSVNEVVHIVINNLGQVTQASATGNDSVVGHCLEDEVRRWRWPGGGEVSVPFHFLRQ